MTCDTKDFILRKGETFNTVIRWEAPPIIWRPISAISQTAPVQLTVPGHGCPDNWRVEVSSKKSMREIDGLKGLATVIDPDTIEINTINASGFKPYKGDGYLAFNTPVDMTGMTARMAIKDKVGGTELLRLSTLDSTIALDVAACTIRLTLPATVTEALTWRSGVYDLELVSIDGTVTRLLSGKIRVMDEVTT